ncbi:type III pantothenate kinase [Bordetella pertussis]|uniref:type III pantothenate kinase n=1 Tax=Bordetella pertussis TaxID=520 RepID=UPI0005DE7358|nr:type III pantothenate kinase [Bordetella pertussis]CPQ57607.1 Bvg accessory factor [Bordetella pertussis]
MIILIDSGNSRLKVGWFDPDAPQAAREPAPVAFDNLDLDALGRWLATLPRRPQRALGVNVAGLARGEAIAATLRAGGCDIRWLRAQPLAMGLRNGYRNPDQLGADRWACMVGVLARQPSVHPPLLVASFGTATTLDTIGPDNVFPGGLILPGPAMMRGALAYGTAHLPLADGLVADYPIDTHQAIASGIAAAQAGAIVRQWLGGRQRYGQAPEIYVAGGGWPEVRQEAERLLAVTGAAFGATPQPTYLDSPVLDGLAALAAQGAPTA